jgi:hypothetical protein
MEQEKQALFLVVCGDYSMKSVNFARDATERELQKSHLQMSLLSGQKFQNVIRTNFDEGTGTLSYCCVQVCAGSNTSTCT